MSPMSLAFATWFHCGFFGGIDRGTVSTFTVTPNRNRAAVKLVAVVERKTLLFRQRG